MKSHYTIVVSSPQGGAGKSTLTVNLALHYARQNKRVLLIDMALYGSVPSMLKIPIRGAGMSSLITVMEQSDNSIQDEHLSGYFKDSIITYKENRNLHILLSASPLKMEKMTLAHAEQIIRIAKKENYDIVLIDTSSELCQRNIVCLDQADRILIPTLQDVTSGWKIILYKEVLENLNINKEKISLVVNKCSKYSGFNNKELQTEIDYPIISEIPDLTKHIMRHINTGIPIEHIGKRKVVLPFHQLAGKLLEGAAAL